MKIYERESVCVWVCEWDRERERERERERDNPIKNNQGMYHAICYFVPHCQKSKNQNKEQIGMKQNKNMMCLPFLTLYPPFCMLCMGFTLFKCTWSKASLLLPWCNWKITFDAAHTIHHASSFWRAPINSANSVCWLHK